MQPAADITLGIIAGGLATRLGGRDKAWLQRDGLPQVLRIAQAHAGHVMAIVVSANRELSRYASHGLSARPDRLPGIGPLGALETLANCCATTWLLTLPVDSVMPGDAALVRALQDAGGEGAVLEDVDGVQPLVALYRVAALRVALAAALAEQAFSVRDLQRRMQLAQVRLPGFRLGNLNTPEDLRDAGCSGG